MLIQAINDLKVNTRRSKRGHVGSDVGYSKQPYSFFSIYTAN